MASDRIRVRRRDRERLKALKRVEAIREQVGSEEPTYEEILQLVLPVPDDDTILERPEEDMVFVNLKDAYEKTHSLAGDNVPAHKVVSEYLDEFTDEIPEEEFEQSLQEVRDD